jgi:NADH:ubiquinone oxidoreductase subunit K
VRLGRKTWDDLQDLLPVENWYDLDATTLLASRALLRHSYRRYAVFVLRSCFEHHRYYALLAGILFVLTLVGRGMSSRPRLLLLTASGLWLANLAVVAAVEIPQMRYTFYFDGILLAAVALALMGVDREVRQVEARPAGPSA